MNDKHLFRIRGALLKVPYLQYIVTAVQRFSPFERVVFFILLTVFIGSALGMLSRLNNFFLVETPKHGGSFVEGIVGSPRFINPILAVSDVDRDMSQLIYSGLLKAMPDGTLIKDLAESYSISEDGLVYDFLIREGVVFHDNTPVTADDVVFTVTKALDPAIKSPRRASWDGVGVEKVSDREIRFHLTRPYAPFLQNTTLGILPKHIWEEVTAEQFAFSPLNIEPIGSGPYRIATIKKNSSGSPQSYTLKSFRRYALNRPYITKLITKFYSTEDALIEAYRDGDIEAMNSISPENLSSLATARVELSPLPRIFAVFFNQNVSQIFSHIEVRKALDVALDKEAIVDAVLGGYGTAIDSPLPPGSIAGSHTFENIFENSEERLNEARAILERNGWTYDEEEGVWDGGKKGVLVFSLSTSNIPELKSAAEIVKAQWEELGARVTLKLFDIGSLNQNVIRPREYDALLFGEVIGRELDLFAFWHSSQRNDPGLNIAQYANITADKLLEDGRTILDLEKRNETYLSFEEEVRNDTPAIFLYSPDFIYIMPKNILGVSLGSVTTSGERFLNIHEWYIKTDNVWSIFTKRY